MHFINRNSLAKNKNHQSTISRLFILTFSNFKLFAFSTYICMIEFHTCSRLISALALKLILLVRSSAGNKKVIRSVELKPCLMLANAFGPTHTDESVMAKNSSKVDLSFQSNQFLITLLKRNNRIYNLAWVRPLKMCSLSDKCFPFKLNRNNDKLACVMWLKL